MKRALTKNWGLKLLAFVFSVLLWIIVMNIEDPVDERTFSGIQVTVTHPEIVTNPGNTYQILEDSRTISVTVKKKRSILNKMNMKKKNKMKEFSILNKVGYVYSDLKKMLLKENILYFICVLVIPLPYLIFMAREFILMNSTMLFFYSGLFIYYVVTLLICLLLNYHAGKIQLLKGE